MATTQKLSKKRPATTQSGPTPKKVHLTKPAKGKQTVADKKRSRPVTLAVQDEKYDSEEEDFQGFDESGDDMRLDVEVRANEMDVDSSNVPPKDPNGMFPLLMQLYANISLVYLGQYALPEIFVQC
jgi:pumilio homology domain family member 6